MQPSKKKTFLTWSSLHVLSLQVFLLHVLSAPRFITPCFIIPCFITPLHVLPLHAIPYFIVCPKVLTGISLGRPCNTEWHNMAPNPKRRNIKKNKKSVKNKWPFNRLNCEPTSQRGVLYVPSRAKSSRCHGRVAGGVGHGPKSIMGKKSKTAHLHLTCALFTSLVTP